MTIFSSSRSYVIAPMKTVSRSALAAALIVLVVACHPCTPPASATTAVDLRTHAERDEDRSVALLVDGEPSCAGVWLSENRILTAYHCVRDAGHVNGDSLEGLLEELGVPPSILPKWPGPIGQMTQYTDKAGALSKPIIAYTAMIDRIDEGDDLALLLPASVMPPHDFAGLGSYVLHDGDEIDVVGSPGGEAFQFTHGYVSGTRDPIGTEHDKFKRLVLDVRGWFGNSGGGVFDVNGDVAGIFDEEICLSTKDGSGAVVPVLGVAIHKDTIREFLK